MIDGSAFAWRNDALVSGEYWRLVTGHFVHYSLAHAALNLLGAALVFALYRRRYSSIGWLTLIAWSIVVIDVGLLFATDVVWYVGASGVLHAAMAAGILDDLLRRERYAWPIAILGATKLGYELRFGALPWPGAANSEMPVIYAAHFLGVAAGLTWSSWWHVRHR